MGQKITYHKPTPALFILPVRCLSTINYEHTTQGRQFIFYRFMINTCRLYICFSCFRYSKFNAQYNQHRTLHTSIWFPAPRLLKLDRISCCGVTSGYSTVVLLVLVTTYGIIRIVFISVFSKLKFIAQLAFCRTIF